MGIEVGIAAVKALIVILMVLSLAGVLGWMERKGSALIQDRIGANRASIFGVAGAGLVNTMMADPLKFLTKEDIIPDRADRLLHTLAPCVNLFPVIVAFAAIPFGDAITIGGRVIGLQAIHLNVGMLYVLAMLSLGVYGVVLGGWASNDRFSLLGGIRGSAQMISYEIGMGLSIVAMVMTFGTLDLQEMVRAQGHLIGGWLPAWGILYQPFAFLIFLCAGIAESKRVPFDLPEGESELVSGYFTEYSGIKYLMFFMTDFAEIAVVAGLVTTLFFGGWQVPYLLSDGFHFPGGATLLLPVLLVVLLQVAAFMVKVLVFCWVQILVRWTLPRLRYDQLMRFGWKGLLPLALANMLATAFIALAVGGPGPILLGVAFFVLLMTLALAGVVVIGGIEFAGLSAGHVVFALLASLIVLSALGVVLSRSPVRSALSLVMTLFLLAVTFMSLGAHMVAMLQVIVYAGAIMVLFLFVIMLLNLQEDRPAMVRVGMRAAAAFVASLFLLSAMRFLDQPLGTAPAATTIPAGFGGIEQLAEVLFTRSLLAFEVTSILLLVAIVGAVVLAKRTLV